MKKIFYSALVATVAIGGAFVSNANARKSVKSKSLTSFTYFVPTLSCYEIVCDDQFIGPSCSTVYGAPLPTRMELGFCFDYAIVQGNLSLD